MHRRQFLQRTGLAAVGAFLFGWKEVPRTEYVGAAEVPVRSIADGLYHTNPDETPLLGTMGKGELNIFKEIEI